MCSSDLPWSALETAQTKVEARNFEIRKNLLRFDDVMNSQRKEIYSERVELMATARAQCTISTPNLVLNEGAQFDGDCKMPRNKIAA